MISCSCVPSSPQPLLPDSFQLLCEQYRRHTLEVRQISLESACKQLAYLQRFLLHIGPHRNPPGLLQRTSRRCHGRFYRLQAYAGLHLPNPDRQPAAVRPFCHREGLSRRCGLHGEPPPRLHDIRHNFAWPTHSPEAQAVYSTRLDPNPLKEVEGSRKNFSEAASKQPATAAFAISLERG